MNSSVLEDTSDTPTWSAAAAAAAREKSAAAALPRCCCRAAALLLLPPLLWLPLPLLRHATTNAAASCVTTAVWGSRAASRGCLGQRLHSLVACLPDVRVGLKPARPAQAACVKAWMETVICDGDCRTG